MPRYFTMIVLLLALVATSAFAADDKSTSDSGAVRAGGLMCFSLQPEKSSVGVRSCDQLCAGKNAACVSLEMNGARNPGLSCADKVDGVVIAGCRCCALEHR